MRSFPPLVFPEARSFSLSYLSRSLGLSHEPVHRALGDVNATLSLLGKCWDRLCELPEEQLAPARRFLGRLPYPSAVCWIGACLADALHYAHERKGLSGAQLDELRQPSLARRLQLAAVLPFIV